MVLCSPTFDAGSTTASSALRKSRRYGSEPARSSDLAIGGGSGLFYGNDGAKAFDQQLLNGQKVIANSPLRRQPGYIEEPTPAA